MTERHAGFIVTLEQDIRSDDSEAVENALRHIKGVLSVTPVVADVETHIAYQRAFHNISNRIYGALKLMDL